MASGSVRFDDNASAVDATRYASSGERLKSHGTGYHDRVLTLYVTRFLAAGDRFAMTCEIEQAGKFDDVVLYYAHDDRTICRLVQIKHKRNASNALERRHVLGADRAFDLRPYFHSYLEIVHAHRFERAYGCEIRDVVISTNVALDDRLRADTEPCRDDVFDGHALYRLVESSATGRAVAESVLRSVTDDERVRARIERLGVAVDGGAIAADVGDFLRRLKFDVGRTDEDVARDVERNVAVRLNALNCRTDPKIVCAALLDRVTEFHLDLNVRVVTNEHCSEWFADACGKDEPPHVVYHRYNTSVLRSRGLGFTADSLRALEGAVLASDAAPLTHVRANRCTVLTTTKLVQILERASKEFVLLAHDQLPSSVDGLSAASLEYLVVDCKTDAELAESVVSIERIRDAGDVGTIVVVSAAAERSPIDDDTAWDDLDEATRLSLLRREISFQGRRVRLSDLDLSSAKHRIGAEIIASIADGTFAACGRFDDAHSDETSYFVDRSVRFCNRVDRSVFETKSPDELFVVSGVDRDELHSLASEMSLSLERISCWPPDGTAAEFDARYRRHADRNVTWIEREGGAFFWKRSSRSVESVRRFLIVDRPACARLERLDDVDDDAVLIVAEPGMGKSNLLYVLASRMIRERRDVWTIKIDLNSHTGRFGRMQREGRTFGDLRTVVEFVAETQRCGSEFERCLLRSYLTTARDRLVVLLDGFDEVTPHYRTIVGKLVRFLSRTLGVRVWITSRPQEREFLEREMNTLARTLVEFTADDQRTFFRKYWRRRFGTGGDGDGDDATLTRFIDRLLRTISVSSCDFEKSLTGIPLQCRMIAEVYEGAFELFRADESALAASVDIVTLYGRFVDMKFERDAEEKKRLDMSKIGNMLEMEGRAAELTREYELLGACAIFPDVYGRFLSADERRRVDAYKGRIRSGEEKVGIVHAIVDGTPVFVNKTFAEYFAALWANRRVAASRDRARCACGGRRAASLVRYLGRRMFEAEYDVFRRFFDRLATDVEAHECVLSEDVRRLDELTAARGASIDETDAFGRSALHLAAASRRDDVVALLVRRRADTRREDALFGWKPVRYAVVCARWANVDALLVGNERDRTIYRKIRPKAETLLEAASRGHANLVGYLIAHGVDPNAVRRDETALRVAARHGRRDVCALLVESGADVDRRAHDGRTALHEASGNGHVGVVEYLLGRGAAVNATTLVFNSTPLHEACFRGHVDVVRAFVERRADVVRDVEYAERLVHEAVYSDRVELVELLARNGADVDSRKYDKETPLHVASICGKIEMADVLLGLGADVDAVNEFGSTPLIAAVKRKKLAMVRFLVERGADVGYRSRGSDVSVLHYAAQHGSLKIIEFLVDERLRYGDGASYDAYINARDADGKSVLHYAARHDKVQIVEYLVRIGVDVNAVDAKRRTCLYEAIKAKHYDLCRYLVEETALDVAVVDAHRNSALHWAAFNTWHLIVNDIFELLLERGIDRTLRNVDGVTALDIILNDRFVTESSKEYYARLFERYEANG